MTKIQIQTLAIIAIIGSFLTPTYAASIDASIESVNVIDPKTLSVSLKETIEGAEFTGDAKVLKDLTVKSATKDPKDAKIVNVVLSNDLLPNNSYSLLSIFGAEGNMDFTLKSTFINTEFPNGETDAAIQKIVVKDPKNIDVYYKMDLKSEEIEYKILSNLGVEHMKKDTVNPKNILFSLKTPFEPNTAYILMLVNLKTPLGDEVNFSEGIYDFNSKTFGTTLAPMMPPMMSSGSMVPPQDALIDLNAAAVIEPNTTQNQMEQKFVEEVAATATSTPHTGPEVWIMILGALIMNSLLFYTKRKKA